MLRTVVALCGAIAVVCAVLMPLLPVAAERPVVSWPAVPGRPEPTSLALTTQRPLTLDVRFTCDDARAAAARPGGLILATAPPLVPEASGVALLARMDGERLTVTSRGTPLVDGPLPPGPCEIAVAGELSALVVTVDDAVVATAPGEAMPDVDALVPGSTDPGSDLSVRLELDDQAATSPTALKSVVTALLVLSGAGALLGLALLDRRVARRRGETGDVHAAQAVSAADGGHREGLVTLSSRDAAPAGAGNPPGPAGAREWLGERARRLRAPSVVDLVVPAVMVVWLFLAPATDDDGYYGAMAANVANTGYVANYYQLYNQSFTPFTWIYHALSWWQSIAGTSPVAMRVPALLCGFATWVLARLIVSRHVLPEGTGRRTATALRAVLALAFLGWWLPYAMGVRPEAVVSVAVLGSLLALLVAVERHRAALAGLAVFVAGFGFTAAPTGFVALAPLLAGAPAVIRMLAARGRADGLVSGLAVVAGGTVVGLLAFADGSLRDFTRAQQIFLGMQSQETWYSEFVRWNYLLSDGPMGNYAKRLPVLLGLLALIGVVALLAVARGRVRGLPPRVVPIAATTAVGFLLLWMTPSKWTHHFGTLSGIGPVLLAVVLVLTPLTARALGRDRPLRLGLPVGVLVVLCLVVALAGHGPNAWPYSWLLGLPDPEEPPRIGVVPLDLPLVWWAIAALAVGGAVLLARWRGPSWRRAAPWLAVPLVACVALATTTAYLVGSFATAAAATADTFSPWAAAVQDPGGTECRAENAIQALDPTTARPLATLAEPLPVGGEPGGAVGGETGGSFVPGGWFPSSPPPTGPDVPARGSFVASPERPEAGNDGTLGTYTSPWYLLPTTVPEGSGLSVYVSGRTGAGNEVRVEYGRPAPEGPRVVPLVAAGDPPGSDVGAAPSGVLGETSDGDAADAVAWRSEALEGELGPPPGASLVRIVAADESAASGGWSAFTAPVVQRWTSAIDLVPEGTATAVGWPIAFVLPCLRKPVQANGINEPVATVVTWGDEPMSGLSDGAFVAFRGGLFTQSRRDSAVTQLSARLAGSPDVTGTQVYTFSDPLPPGRYRLDRDREIVAGWSAPPNTTFSTPVDEVTVR